MTRDEAIKLVGVLKAAYPRQDIGQETLVVYASFLADLDCRTAQAAVRRHIATSTFFPSIAEIRRAAVSAAIEIPSPEEAWEEVVAAVRARGYYNRPAFSHPLIDRAASIIGWANLCGSDTPGVERAHYLRVYESLAKRSHEDANLGSLGGRPLPAVDGPRRAGETLAGLIGNSRGGR